MKRTFILIVACLLVLAACSPGSEVNQDPPPEPSAESQEAAAPEPTAEPDPTQVTETEEETEEVEDVGDSVGKFEIFNPYQAFSEEEMTALGAADFSGTDQEIAQMIINWQNSNMHYIGDPNQQADISHPMRWNFFLPGIYPVRDMVQDRRMADGKIYGLCWDYSSIFVAMAEYYDLECRVTAYKTLMSDLNPIFQAGAGMSQEEYTAILPRLGDQGLDIDHDHISRSARETWSHYRAEVKIGEEWVAFDGAPGVSEEYASYEYDLVNWDEGYDAELLYGEVVFSEEGLNIPGLAELLASAPVEGYEGITDDAGNSNRAANLEDLVAGKGLVPYFENIEEIKAFFSTSGGEDLDLDWDEFAEIKADYEEDTGKLFFAIADALIYMEEELSAEDYVPYYNAFTGSDITIEDFNEWIK
jgi:hypothetical protein